jgi:hypothetical protein
VPITTYLPDFTVHSAFEAHPERHITLRMLLGCTAGFTHEAPLGNNYEPEVGDFEAHVRSISDTWLRFPVGTGEAYSNLGFDPAAFSSRSRTSRSPRYCMTRCSPRWAWTAAASTVPECTPQTIGSWVTRAPWRLVWTVR